MTLVPVIRYAVRKYRPIAAEVTGGDWPRRSVKGYSVNE